MNTRIFIQLMILFVSGHLFGQAKKQKYNAPKYELIPRLNHPFGTILKLRVEIIDGDSLRMKEHQSSFLIRVKEIENKTVPGTLIIGYEDRTIYFPKNIFELYEHIYKRKAKEVDLDTTLILKKQYIGREFNIAAYESGFFWGVPDGYTKHQSIRQEPSFHFKSYLVVVADLNKPLKDQ